MAVTPRKAKAKRPGRPRLSKDARREVRSVRLPAALIARMEAYGDGNFSAGVALAIADSDRINFLSDNDVKLETKTSVVGSKIMIYTDKGTKQADGKTVRDAIDAAMGTERS